jgi:hypothetical protein
VVVDGGGHAITYDGSGWSSPTSIDTVGLTAVSCPSASFCVAVDRTGNQVTRT